MINQQTLELYVYIDGINDVPFWSYNYQDFVLANGEQFVTSDGKVFNVRILNENIIIHAFTYNAQRMGAAPTITTTIKYSECLDELFSEKVYAIFNGERYFLSATPSSSYSKDEIMYKHEATFVSERIALENIYFYDVVTKDADVDKPVSNSSDFSFFGDIVQFAERMNHSLSRANLDYAVVIDEGITSEEKLLTIENKFFSEVLQEVYNTYDLPYYFAGKEIHIGYTTNAISEVFRYGDSDALVSISKSNTNNRTINRVTGMGSEDNIPYYYPNNSPKGELIAKVDDKNEGVHDENVTIINPLKFANTIEESQEIRYIENAAVSLDNIRHTQSVNGDGKGTPQSFDIHFTSTLSQGGTFESLEFANSEFVIYSTEDISNVENSLLTFVPRIYDMEREWWAGPNEEGLDINERVIPSFLRNIELELNIWYKDGRHERKIIARSYNEKIEFDTNGTLISEHVDTDVIDFYVPSNVDHIKFVFRARYRNHGWTHSKLVGRWDIGVQSESYWTYNNNIVKLEDLGLEINTQPKHGDVIMQVVNRYIQPQKNLMPPIYRKSLGDERFYNAKNNEYEIPNDEGATSGLLYEFENEYNGYNPKEQIVQFEEIKPSIKEVLNDQGLRIDMFSEFAYDEDDNDETFENENGAIEYRHPYFFAKLRKLDFNLFDHAIDDGEMTISMTSGHCGGCEFLIAVDEDSKKNTVQVYLHDTTDENGIFHAAGTLQRDAQGNVLCGGITNVGSGVTEQDIQQDTINNEVWIALKKDKDTYGVLMPHAGDMADNEDSIRPKSCSSPSVNDGDTFVILNISLPQRYILAAEEKLRQQLIHYMWENNTEKFSFAIKFSRIFFAEHPSILNDLDENSRITIEYDGVQHTLYVSSITYKATEDAVLPEITVELKDELSVSKNAIQKATAQVKAELYQTLYGIDVIAQGSQVFLRKDRPDTANQPITFKEITNLEGGATLDKKMASPDYFEGVKGFALRKDENGNWHLETDYINARKKFTAKEVEIQKVYHISGAQIKSAASMVCTRVDDIGNAYRCWFDTVDDEGNVIYNQFVAGDQAYVRTFNLVTDSEGNTTNHFYWRLVESVDDNSIVLSKLDCAEGSTIPMVGDHIVQLGYQGNDRPERQVAVIDAGAGESAPYYRQYVGINSFALPEPETQLKPNDNILTGRVTIKEGSILSGAVEVYDNDVVVAGINGSDTDSNYAMDDDTLMIFAGANGVGNAKDANFRVTKSGKVVAKEAHIEGTINATSGTFDNGEFTNAKVSGEVNATSGTFRNGTFNNVTINGSVASPLQAYNGTILRVERKAITGYLALRRNITKDKTILGVKYYAWANIAADSVYYTRTTDIGVGFTSFYTLGLNGNAVIAATNLTVILIENAMIGNNGLEKHDNLAIPVDSTKRQFSSEELDWSISSSGRVVRFINAPFNGAESVGYAKLNAPSGKYFFEDGEQYSSIIFSNETIELFGYGDDSEFYGWIVLNRKSVSTNSTYGSPLNVIYQGVIRGGKVTKIWTPSVNYAQMNILPPTWSGGVLSIPYHDAYRGLHDTNNWEVIVTNGVVKAKNIGTTTSDSGKNWNTIRVQIDVLSGAENILFQVISTADWFEMP